jgi:predicted kinase
MRDGLGRGILVPCVSSDVEPSCASLRPTDRDARLAGAMFPVSLLVVCGLPFAGKTTLEQELRRWFELAHVDVDDTKRELFGPAVRDKELSRADWERIFAETDDRIARYLRAGRSVVDASRNFRRAERDHARGIAAENRAKAVTIFVDTPVELVRRRLAENRLTRTRQDLTDEEFEHLLRLFDPPAPDEQPIVLAHGEDLTRWIARNIAVIH